MEVVAGDSLVERGQRLLTLVEFAVTHPFEHQLVREDLVVVNLQAVFVEKQVSAFGNSLARLVAQIEGLVCS